MEFARQNFEDAQRVSNFDAHWANYYDAFNSVNDRIKTATGTALENPVSSSQGPGAAAEALVTFSREGVQQMTPVQAWTKSVKELRAKHADALPWDDIIDEPHRVAWAKMKEVRERTDLMTEQAGLLQGKDVPLVGSIPKAGPAIGTFVAFPYNLVTSPGYTASQLAGSLAGQMTSPVDASVNLLSFGAGGAAKSLLKNMVLNASVNAVGQAALSAPKQASYKSAGLPYGVEVWLNEVAGAAATGGALDLSIRGPSRAILTRYGRDTPAGTMFSRNTERGGFLLDAIEAPKLPEAPVRPVIEPELIKKAEAGDIAATRTIAERTGAINDLAIKGGLDFMEMGGKVSDETLARMDEMGLARWDGMRMLAQAIQGRVPEVPGVVAKADHPLMPAEAHRILTEGADRFEAMMRDASPKLDTIDPRLARYVTDAVDAGLGRVVPLVQKALDNGGPDALVREISRLADEVGADRLAAEATIHTSKNPLAVAAAIRQHPDLVTTALDLGAPPVKIGRAIAGMDDIAHQAVMRGAVHPEVAAMVAERVPRQHQAKVISDLEAAHPRSLTEAAELIDALTPEPRRGGTPLDGGIRIDDPAGPEAKRQVEALKQEAGRPFDEAMRPIAERQQLDKQVMDLKGKIAEAERKPADEATALEIGKLRAGLHEAETRLAAVKVELDQSEGAAAVHRMVMREIDIKRANDALRALRDAAALAERILPDGTKIEFKDDLRYQGLELDGITTEAGDVAIFRHAMNPAAILGHETVHALRRRGLISESEIKTLAKLAREEGVFEKEARYREEYKDRANFESLIDEEAAAAYIEARIKGDAKGPENTTAARIQQFFERLRNLLSGYGFKSEQDVVNALLSGDMARRQGSVQDWMRQEDVTAFAMREGDDHVANAWDELARQDYSYERARWHEVTRPTKPQAPDMARRENDAIMKKAASAERDMIRQGLSPREIAAAMNKLHGTSLTAEDIAARNVWWNVDNKLPPAFDKAPDARTSWTPELTALVETMVQDGALFGDIAKEVSKVVGRDVDPATIYNRVVRTASERKTVGKPIEPSSAWPADALNILRSDEIKDLSYSKISSLLEDRTGNIYSRNAVASKLAAIRREKGDPLFAIRDERSADARFELERPKAVRGELGAGSGRSSGQQPAQGAAIAGDSSGAGRVGNNAGPREFRIPGYNGRVVELENSAGQRTRNYFVYPPNAEVTTKLSGASALKYMQQVHNWTARMTLTEMAPGAWEVKGVKVRSNQRRSGVGTYVYDMIERDLEAPIRPSGMLTDDGHGFWSNRDPEAVKNHRQVGDMWLSPKQLMNMKVLISQIAETETDPAQIMRLMRQNQQINDGIKSLPKEVFEPKAINAMFAFAGERAKTADLEALNRAKEMTVAGLDRAKIWHDTGWFQGVDGKWRFEIDDSNANLRQSTADLIEGKSVPLGAFYRHDDLFSAYPEMADTPFAVTSAYLPGEGAMARTSDGRNVIVAGYDAGRVTKSDLGVVDVLPHEGQHITQGVEGFAQGGTPSAFASPMNSRKAWIARLPAAVRATLDERGIGKLYDSDAAWPAIKEELRQRIEDDIGQPFKFRELSGMDGMDEADMALERSRTYTAEQLNQQAMTALRNTGAGTYNRLAGEVEARTVQKRMDLTADERRARPPWLDYDVPEEQQIVRGAGEPMFALRAEAEAEARPLMRAAAERGVTLPDGSIVHGVPLFSIRAFHGSPHDFDRFDLSRIGNGEGQQAFGHGLYFAESPAVAKWYQEKLRRPDPQHDSLLDLIEAAREINSAKSIKEILAPVERDVEHMKKSLDDATARRGSFGRVSWMWNREPAVPRRTTIGFYPKLIAEKEAILAMARSMTDAEIEQRLAARAGRMYEVEIDGNIDQFYHMDRPYEEQSQIIKDLIAKSRMAHLAPMDFSEIAITPKGAKALLDIGILGIRYLDGNSRDGGEGTHNYVVFDDKLVTIVKKNGRPVTAPPLFSLRADSDPDPMIKSDMAFIDRLAQMKDLIEACRA